MARKIQVVFIAIFVFLSTGVVSCQKKDLLSTPYSRVAGKWKKVRYATDDNGNGVIDGVEVHDTDPEIVNTLELKRDSTGIETATFSQDLSFRWLITGENSLMTIYDSGDTIIYKIPLVTSANLHLTTKTKFGLAGYYYDTQK